MDLCLCVRHMQWQAQGEACCVCFAIPALCSCNACFGIVVQHDLLHMMIQQHMSLLASVVVPVGKCDGVGFQLDADAED